MKLSISFELDTVEEFHQISKLLEPVLAKQAQKLKLETVSQEDLKVQAPIEAPRNRLIPLTKWDEYHPWPSVSGLRHLVFYEKTNGFSACIKRVGGRVIIDEKAFFEWFKQQP